MAKTLVDIDDDLLVEASTALGTATKRDTVNEALRMAVDSTRERRRLAREEIERLVQQDGVDFSKIDDLDL